MDRSNPLEIAQAIARLGLWRNAASCNWALLPAGAKEPWLVVGVEERRPPVRARLLFFPGWTPFHYYVITSRDHDFGVAVTPSEIEHFELVHFEDGAVKLSDCFPGCVPIPLPAERGPLAAKLLWECYGFLMRLEEDSSLALRYAGERALFSRREGPDGKWADAPLPLPGRLPQFVEQVALEKALLQRAADLPFRRELAIEFDLFLVPGVSAAGPRPRNVYLLAAVDPATGARHLWQPLTTNGRSDGLLALWQRLAQRLLAAVVARGEVPGVVHVRSLRMMRFLRPLGMHLPFKLTVNSKLPALDAEVARAVKERKL